MLVLTRKVGESIKVNDDVKITAIEVKGKNIRLGIEAPKTTKIYREEVFLKIKEENKTAASTPAGFDPGKITNFVKDNLILFVPQYKMVLSDPEKD
jgi:carbon storage regulator